jgi:3,4-dihydroxy 2-butanone 4-phosphate synthase/GTP cyclohydrolase II
MASPADTTPSADRLTAVTRAIEAIGHGRMVVLVDDEDRENEGDLVMAADLCTPDDINFMARHGRGLICLSLTEERVERLGLPMMVMAGTEHRSPRTTAFTVSIDARQGTTTGISARERAETIRAAVGRDAGPDDIVTPGHIFPLRARRGGVLVRSGHTEGSVDLARLAGREPAGVICEIMREDGEMARMPDLQAFAAEHGIPILKIADLIEYRLSREMLVHQAGELAVRPRLGGLSREFRALHFTTDVEETEYLALVLGEIRPDQPVLVRVQTGSVLRDVFGASASPDDEPATVPLRMIEEAGAGILLYVLPRGRARLGSDFHHTAEAASAPGGGSRLLELRDFGLGAQVLAQLGARQLRLLTNHPRRIVGVAGYGLHIVEVVPIRPQSRVVPLREGGQQG